jgi:hypothetical protein
LWHFEISAEQHNKEKQNEEESHVGIGVLHGGLDSAWRLRGGK